MLHGVVDLSHPDAEAIWQAVELHADAPLQVVTQARQTLAQVGSQSAVPCPSRVPLTLQQLVLVAGCF